MEGSTGGIEVISILPLWQRSVGANGGVGGRSEEREGKGREGGSKERGPFSLCFGGS